MELKAKFTLVDRKIAQLTAVRCSIAPLLVVVVVVVVVVYLRLNGRVGAGNLQLSNGFNSVLPLEHLAEFDASELELLLCGKPQHRHRFTNAPIHCSQARQG